MGPVEDDIQRRRERGRRSQAAFRKRQAQAAQLLTDQNRWLGDGVRQVVNAARGDERPELLHSILGLAKIAGIDANRLERRRVVQHLGGDDITIDAVTGDFVHRFGDQANSPLRPSHLSPPIPQRLSCGIWLDPLHYMRASLPPKDILPYLGPGAKTFAGRLFWSMAEHGQTRCKHTHSEPAVLIQRGLRHSEATQDLEIPFIQAMLETRLEYKRTGSINPEHAAAGETDLGMILQDRIEEDYRARGEDPSSWLSCAAIEERARMIFSNSAFALLEKAAKGFTKPQSASETAPGAMLMS